MVMKRMTKSFAIFVGEIAMQCLLKLRLSENHHFLPFYFQINIYGKNMMMECGLKASSKRTTGRRKMACQLFCWKTFAWNVLNIHTIETISLLILLISYSLGSTS